MVNDIKKYPNNNWDLMETNEIGANAWGGTEMYMSFIYNGGVPRHLLEQVQIIPSRLRHPLKEDKIRIWFEHNLAGDPESQKALKDPEMRKKFHKVVYLSQWHYQQFQHLLGIPYDSQSAVIEGGFEVDDQDSTLPEKPDPKDVVHISYHTTPHRGLQLLVPVFEHLAKEDPKVHLHVHSSFKMYGWDERDQQFEPLYEACRNHPQITYHGYTEYYKLRELMPKYHIFAYPNIWPETMCRAVLESMYFGQVCVHPNLAATTDTTGCLNPFMYNGTSDPNEHLNIFYQRLKGAVDAVRDDSEGLKNMLTFIRGYIISRYNTSLVHNKWTLLLEELVQKYPEGQRGFPQEEWVYRI